MQGTSAPHFSTPLWNHANSGFATNLEHLFASFGVTAEASAGVPIAAGGSSSASEGRPQFNSTVRAWIYGHTHYNCDNIIHGTVCCSWCSVVLVPSIRFFRHASHDVPLLHTPCSTHSYHMQRVVSNQKGYALWGPSYESEGGPAYRKSAVLTV